MHVFGDSPCTNICQNNYLVYSYIKSTQYRTVRSLWAIAFLIVPLFNGNSSIERNSTDFVSDITIVKRNGSLWTGPVFGVFFHSSHFIWLTNFPDFSSLFFPLSSVLFNKYKIYLRNTVQFKNLEKNNWLRFQAFLVFWVKFHDFFQYIYVQNSLVMVWQMYFKIILKLKQVLIAMI